MKPEKYYITTAIAYTSGKPHIGNIYEIVLADAIARFKRLEGYDVYFMTGTDEHGQKIEAKAQAAGQSPQAFVDEVATEIQSLFDLMNTSYDRFIRTTEAQHKRQVQKMFKQLYDQGDIYKSEYEGMYCTACESFYTTGQLQDGKCPDCGAEVHSAKEESYFFKLSKYADRLVKHIEEHPEFIQPESRKNEMINNFIKPGLQDLAVSRTSFKWGIPVDFDDKHVVYVWIDALSNYLTGLGFDVDGQHDPRYQTYWPADLHLIGKDILRFHTIYWPIMLMALKLPLPKQVFGHPWLLVGEGKMSKSKGNVLYADDLVKVFGVDAVRYLMLHGMPFAQDGTMTYETMIEHINTDLANIFGNLVNRTLAMTNKYLDGYVSNPKVADPIDEELLNLAKLTPTKVRERMAELRVQEAIDVILDLLIRCNKYIDETTPWNLAKDSATHNRLASVLYHLLESIRISAVLLQAFIPDAATSVLDQLNTHARSFDSLSSFGQLETNIRVSTQPSILFARLDVAATLERLSPKVDLKLKEEIDLATFERIDLRIGKVLTCEAHPKSDKLLVLQVDLGGEVRQIVSGIRPRYQPADLVSKHVVVVANLKPITLRGVTSQGMVLLGEAEDDLELIELHTLKHGTVR
jgi:methionyl-tRNA synthetase